MPSSHKPAVDPTFSPTDPLLFDDDSGTESESDLTSLSSTVAKSEAVVTATDWTTETILRQLERGTIELDPSFQRRDAWSEVRKSRFIESLFLGLPIPQIVLAERKDKRGTFIVIDGKQRLLALRQFASQDGTGGFLPLKLSHLQVRSDLNGMTLKELEERGSHPEDLTAFLNQTIRTVVVKNWPDEQFLYLIFLRLNTGSVPLSPQELRKALHPGPFVSFADEFAKGSSAIQSLNRGEGPDFRMRDTELLIRFFAFSRYLVSYSGNLKDFLDTTCEALNAAWLTEENAIREDARRCDHAITVTQAIFKEDAFRRWAAPTFERRFNRAVYDIMVYYFSDSAIATRALEKHSRIVESFKALCDSDADFAKSLQVTTKSIPATFHRFHLWGISLTKTLKLPLPIVSMDKGRLVVE